MFLYPHFKGRGAGVDLPLSVRSSRGHLLFREQWIIVNSVSSVSFVGYFKCRVEKITKKNQTNALT